MRRCTIVSSPLAAAAIVTALAAAALMSGCGAVAYPAAVIFGDTKQIIVDAEYSGLEGQTVAVLVDAHDAILAEHPLAQLEVSAAVSQRIAADVPVRAILDAGQVVDFQHNNIYWNTIPPSDLAKRLNVTRLVLVDLSEYRLHEPGNVNLWRGTVVAKVSVVEADGASPNDRAYSTDAAAQYPPDSRFGAVNADDQTIRAGMLNLFAMQVSNRFHRHEAEVPR